jgi:type I restriction enzyme S subunit
MSAVDEIEGRIKSPEIRTLAEVSKGYTPFQEGDVLFAKITPSMENGKAAIAIKLINGIGFGSTEFHVLRPGEFILAEWIFALIRQTAFRDAAKARFIGTAGQQRVPTSFLESFRIPLPTLSEQRHIRHILSHPDELRRLRRQADEQTQDLPASMFGEMFGIGVMGQQKWPVKRLRKLGEVSYGLTVNQTRKRAGNERPYLRVGNVYRWELDLSDVATIGTLDGDIEKYSLLKGDVLVVEGHANPEELGRAAVWNDELPECLHQNHLLRIRPDTSKITSNYLAGFINSSIGRQHMFQYGKTSSGLYTISSTDLAKIPIVYPPIELQLEFEQRYAAYKAIDNSLPKVADILDDLHKSLFARAFTGELTTAWRERHAEALTVEARQRDEALGVRPRTVRPVEPEVTPAVISLDETHPRYPVLRELSPAQQKICQATLQTKGYFAAENLLPEDDWPVDHVRRTLALLETLGLIARVSLPATPTGEALFYVAVHRQPCPDDDGQADDLAALEAVHPE